mmetsp:Transcript_126052/g.251658  ORF Transcript_126052/g.251658 Transcript_126052/m.251658 type:complete len:158 (+) Transcript_126052:434-907(+)
MVSQGVPVMIPGSVKVQNRFPANRKNTSTVANIALARESVFTKGMQVVSILEQALWTVTPSRIEIPLTSSTTITISVTYCENTTKDHVSLQGWDKSSLGMVEKIPDDFSGVAEFGWIAFFSCQNNTPKKSQSTMLTCAPSNACIYCAVIPRRSILNV